MMRKKITNREEANLYYKRVNELVDDYIKSHKVTPSELYKYINKNMTSFLEDSNLSDVDGIINIVNDVITHRKNIEVDNVMKFERFNNINEGILSISNSGVEHEKVLSDCYGTSLGHIELIDKEIHLYKIKDFGKIKHAIIFSDDELVKVKENILNELIKEAEKKILTIDKIEDISLPVSLRVWFKDICDMEKYKLKCDELLTIDNIIKIVKKSVEFRNEFPSNFSEERLSYINKFNGFHIWEIK